MTESTSHIDKNLEDTEIWDPGSIFDPLRLEARTISLLEYRPVVDATDGNYIALIKRLRQRGELLRSDIDQPKISIKPTWYNEKLFKNASSVYERHFMGINFAHLSGLLLLVRVDSIYRTLSSTGESDTVAKLFKRYYNTVKQVKGWYEGDIFDEGSYAQRSLLIVRGMHNKVSSKFNHGYDNPHMMEGDRKNRLTNNNTIKHNQIHISEYDILITQFAFVGFIVTKNKYMGLIDKFNRHDLESLLHFWRVIGYYLGSSDEFNLCSYQLKDIVGLCEAITEIEFKESMRKNPIDRPQGIMSINIVRSVKFIPMLTIYGIMKYLYELLGYSTEEIESKRNWYSSLSYTLIKLVMSNLLGYRALRSFNNGLTRLSIYLVGKVEDWFASRLETNYGQELRF